MKKFIDEENNYQSIVNAIDILRSDKDMTKTGYKNTLKMFSSIEDIQTINDLHQGDVAEDDISLVKQQLTEQLLDQHGTGRLLFRNTRSAIKGFPKRKLHNYALHNPYEDTHNQSLSVQLSPECLTNLGEDKLWTDIDTRLPWLANKIEELAPKKLLLITSNKQTVLDIAESLRVCNGIHAAVFHEDLSLIQRDKAAAWFADQEKGAQILLCSEIGSEGRNFQFAHHVIFFDLPFNPDLLEQRIGRLDRIGQNNTIHIHVPYLQGTASEKLFNWFHLGLNSFAQTCPAAYSIFNQLKPQLVDHLLNDNNESFTKFVEHTQTLTTQANQDFQKGRDRLLEYNSCRPYVADKLLQDAEIQNDTSCQRFMHRIFDRYGVDYEELRKNVELVKPSESLKTHFPGLIEDGMSVTFDRETALANETLHFLSWEHPMVTESMEMIATQEKGNASLVTLKNTGLSASTIMIESLFNLHVPADASLQLSRYLPTDSIRLVADEKLINRTTSVDPQFIHNNHSSVPLNVALQVIKMKTPEMKKIVAVIEKKAESLVPELIQTAQESAQIELDAEIQRLTSLSEINHNIRPEEIQHLQTQKQQTLTALSQAIMQNNAVRVLVCL